MSRHCSIIEHGLILIKLLYACERLLLTLSVPIGQRGMVILFSNDNVLCAKSKMNNLIACDRNVCVMVVIYFSVGLTFCLFRIYWASWKKYQSHLHQLPQSHTLILQVGTYKYSFPCFHSMPQSYSLVPHVHTLQYLIPILSFFHSNHRIRRKSEQSFSRRSSNEISA